MVTWYRPIAEADGRHTRPPTLIIDGKIVNSNMSYAELKTHFWNDKLVGDDGRSACPALRLIELARFLPAPGRSYRLCRSGWPEVIKVKQPEGERHAVGAAFHRRGSEQVRVRYFPFLQSRQGRGHVDFLSPEGQENPRDGCATSDILIENFKSGF